MISIPWNPDRKTLAEFSEAGMFALGMVAAPLAYFRGQPRFAVAFWCLAVIGRLIGLVRPSWLKPVFLGLTLATWPIGWVVSRVALGLLFLLVFTPMALVFRWTGRDALNRSIDREATSYWEPYRPNRGLDRYLRPF
ncbi:SxtJ family membrane protein [Tundrisphaera lichenicola]|uniref:SxtJ family membrane protein n=1 Tax=Tundrisphaera lichenicola TaxID=2029860 RepID=UPI003EB6A881